MVHITRVFQYNFKIELMKVKIVHEYIFPPINDLAQNTQNECMINLTLSFLLLFIQLLKMLPTITKLKILIQISRDLTGNSEIIGTVYNKSFRIFLQVYTAQKF